MVNREADKAIKLNFFVSIFVVFVSALLCATERAGRGKGEGQGLGVDCDCVVSLQGKKSQNEKKKRSAAKLKQETRSQSHIGADSFYLSPKGGQARPEGGVAGE